MKCEFREDVRCGWDPMDHRAGHAQADFDWDGLYRLMGEDNCPVEQRDYAAMAQALRVVFRWVLELPPDGKRSRSTNRIGRRLLALVWVVSPDLLNASQRRLARRYGCLRQILARHTADARRTFKVRNRYQSHAWNFCPGK